MRDIKGYEGKYAVTSCGKVWSYKSQKFLKPFTDKDGYLLITLYNGKAKTFTVHRLVALAYIPNAENKPQINHKDENRQNNSINNLEWVTAKENINYGTCKIKSAKTREKAVYCVELDKYYPSQKQAALELGINPACISSCIRGLTKTAGHYHWQKAD